MVFTPNSTTSWKETRAGVVPQISVIVLAGGKSQRLGMDKALLKLDGKPLLERIVTTLTALSDDLVVVTSRKRSFARLAARVVTDIYPGKGSLGGIYTGLRAMRYKRGLVVACDMPLLNLNLLRYMILLSANFDVVIPSIGGKTEPLHAVYSKACIEPIASLLRRNELRIISFLSQVQVRYIEDHEVDIFDPEHLSFFNINTQDDLMLAQELIRRRDN